MYKIFYCFIIIYQIFLILINIFGFFLPETNETKKFSIYSYIKNYNILKSNKKLKAMQYDFKTHSTNFIFKELIGYVKINKQNVFIDKYGNELIIDENPQNYIKISGKYKLFHKYHPELMKLSKEIRERITEIHIHSHRITVIIDKNINIKLYKSIKDLDEFYEKFPEKFEENTQIDLRNTRIIGIKKI